LATRCCVLQTMNQEIKNITNYYWFNWGWFVSSLT
jgi:hypothetical protein